VQDTSCLRFKGVRIHFLKLLVCGLESEVINFVRDGKLFYPGFELSHFGFSGGDDEIGGGRGGLVVDVAQLEYGLPDERGLTGVNVYRALGTGEFVRITDTMIPALGLGTYRYADRGLVPGETYRYQLGLVESAGNEVRMGLVSLYVQRAEFTLGEPFPNPTEVGFSVRLSMPETRPATLKIFDVHGREVRTLHRGTLAAGEHTFLWDGRTESGTRAPGGLYFLSYESAGSKALRRGVVMR